MKRLPLTEPILFIHRNRQWLARLWPTSDIHMPKVWQYRAKNLEYGVPDYDAYRAARAYFERMHSAG